MAGKQKKVDEAYRWLSTELLLPTPDVVEAARDRFGEVALAAAGERLLRDQPADWEVRMVLHSLVASIGSAMVVRLRALSGDREAPLLARAFAFSVLPLVGATCDPPELEITNAVIIDGLADVLWMIISGGVGAESLSRGFAEEGGEETVEVALGWGGIPAPAVLSAIVASGCPLPLRLATLVAEAGGVARDLCLQGAAERATLPMRRAVEQLPSASAAPAPLHPGVATLPGAPTNGPTLAWWSRADPTDDLSFQVAVPWRFGLYHTVLGGFERGDGLGELALTPRVGLARLADERQQWEEEGGSPWAAVDIDDLALRVFEEARMTALPLTPEQLALVAWMDSASRPTVRR